MTDTRQSLSWPADRVEKLKALWLAGRSAAQIARIMGGTTRNAVIGKVHRLKLCREESSYMK